MTSFDDVWDRIRRCAGQTFSTATGLPFTYRVPGEYLRIEGHGDTVLVFETDEDGTVTEWRVGVPPYVDYVEGCS